MNYMLDYPRSLHKIRKTCFQMLNDRGYIVSKEDLNQGLEEFKDKFMDQDDKEVDKEKLTIFAQGQDDSDNQIFVFFPRRPRSG